MSLLCQPVAMFVLRVFFCSAPAPTTPGHAPPYFFIEVLWVLTTNISVFLINLLLICKYAQQTIKTLYVLTHA